MAGALTPNKIGINPVVIEHSFVTTLPSTQALTAASEMLTKAGFVAEVQEGFRLGETDWTVLQMKRGKKSVARAKDPTQCPQRIRLDWDRGRVTVAASIQPKVRQRTFYFGGVIGYAIAASATSRRKGKDSKDYSDLMIFIANSLEDLLWRQSSPEIAEQGWMSFEEELRAKAKKARRRSLIMVGILFGVLFIAIAAIAILANNH
jgi:hypothetical protein